MLICFLFIGMLNSLNGQQYYSKMFNLFGAWESATNIVKYNEDSRSLLLSGTFINFFVQDSTKYRHFYIWKLDSLQKPEIKALFGMSGFYYGGMLVFKYPLYHIGVLFEDSAQNAYYNLLIINNDDEDIRKIRVQSPTRFYSTTIKNFENRIYLIGRDGTNSSSTTAPFAILCIDTTGKQLWYKTYPGKRRYTNSVVVDDEGNFVIAGSSYKGDGGAFDTTSGWYAKLDTSGNFIWEKELNRNTPYFTDVLSVFKTESAFYLSSNNDASYFDAHVKDTSFVSLFKLNEVGNIDWYTRYLENPYKKNIWAGKFIQRNNSVYGIGGYISDEGWQEYTQYSMFVKLDLEGNLKWKRLFKQWHRDNRFFSLTAVPDGFIICADGKDTTHTTGFTDAWIIKTDTNGCIIPGCHLTDGLVQITNPDAFINVFPNPASDNVTVQITDERAKLKSYFIYDAQGNYISQQTIHHTPETFSINTLQLPNGNYYLVLELAGGERAVKKLMIQR